jgi:hypothetical protein
VGGWNDLRTPRAALVVAVLAITAATATLVPQTARGEEQLCRGTLGRVAVDSLRVPEGARCVLTGTTVRGTITVQRGATLIANGVRVTGDVRARNAGKVVLRRGSTVGGRLECPAKQEPTAAPSKIAVCSARS